MGFLETLKAGGFAMIPLGICSVITWIIVFERVIRFRRLGESLRSFHLEASNALLRSDLPGLRTLCDRQEGLPTAGLVQAALERLTHADARMRDRWREAVERRRQQLNLDLKGGLWILGTIATAAPFIGLFGTVVGILRSFQDMARTGSGGFAVVAGGISESLIATAAGIIVAVAAVVAYNVFQTQWSRLVVQVRLQTEELAELLEPVAGDQGKAR